jgi:hypothetical protein
VRTHLQLIPRSIKSGFMHLFPHTPSWRNVSVVKHVDESTFKSGRTIMGQVVNYGSPLRLIGS